MAAQNSRVPGLLVSVRCPTEAATALRGGAALIDIKEPRRGALGRADDATIAAVVACVAGRLPVSAALGELLEPATPFAGSGLTFVKWGLAGAVAAGDWQLRHRRRIEEIRVAGGHGTYKTHKSYRSHDHPPPTTRVVTVAYADWQLAGAPPVGEVVAVARERPGSVLLLDTWQKSPGRTLLDWLSREELQQLRQQCREAGLLLALAGSLGPAEIAELLPIHPDWFAVRGAACVGGERGGTVSEERVRGLVELIAASAVVKQPPMIAG